MDKFSYLHGVIYAEDFPPALTMYKSRGSFIAPLQKSKQTSFCLSHAFKHSVNVSLLYTRCLLKVGLYFIRLNVYTLLILEF